MSTVIPHKTKRALYTDINNFAHENFRSGLAIVVRETLRKLTELGVSGEVLSIADSKVAFDSNLNTVGFRKRFEQSILVYEHLLPYDPTRTKFIETAQIINRELHLLAPETVIMNSPAIECNMAHICLSEEVLFSSARAKYLICDELFPERTANNAKLYDKYVSLVRQMDLFAVSQTIATKMAKILGKSPQFLPTPFDDKSIVCNVPVQQREFITLINHHPIKGRIIFDRVAELLPDKRFLIVENWPDVPPYVQKSSNVTFQPFLEDVRQLWSKVRLLIVPSLCNEGRARVVTEAMMNQVPVIANAVGSLPELAAPGLFFVEAPRWDGFRNEDNILYPVISREEVEKASQSYVALINKIDKSDETLKKYGDQAAESANLYWRSAKEAFSSICGTWTEPI